MRFAYPSVTSVCKGKGGVHAYAKGDFESRVHEGNLGDGTGDGKRNNYHGHVVCPMVERSRAILYI